MSAQRDSSGLSRRRFLGALGLGFPAAAAASHGFAPPRLDEVSPGTDTRARLEDLSDTPGRPDAIARDEDFWAEVQEAFTVDRSMVNLNNGGVSPTPGHVLEAMKRDLDYANQMPVYNGWQILEPQREGVRKRLAREWDVHLWNEHQIRTTPIVHEEFQGIRVSPSVYTTLDELDRFVDAMRHAANHGLPDTG